MTIQRAKELSQTGSAAAAQIEVSGVSRSFGQIKAVDGLDLMVRPGEVAALVGPNGSGKTTLLLMLASLLRPDTGHLRVGGHDPLTHPDRVRAIMGWMPDGFGTWDALSVREVLLTMAEAYRLPAVPARERVDELLRMLHLDDVAQRPAKVLSRGQKQRLGLARALVHSPTVLLLDEPASGLDPRSRIELRDVIRHLAAGGTTILISSHILAELEEMADRAIVMAGGRVVATHDLKRSSQVMRRWRITTLDAGRCRSTLEQQGTVFYDVPMPEGDWSNRAAMDVDLADEREAAALLEALVGAGVPVFGFAAQQGSLETAYLAATKERR